MTEFNLSKDNPLIYTYEESRKYTKLFAKSFYFASFFLPREKRYASYSIYTFCRLADNIVDTSVKRGKEDMERLLKKLKISLDKAYANVNRGLIDSAFTDTIKKYNVPKIYFDELIKGVSMDINIKRFKTNDELEVYCYGVASTVGLLMSYILGFSDNEALYYAEYLGKAMQITNILRDVLEDYQMNRIYLPEDEMKLFKYSEEDLKNQVLNENFKKLMKYQIEKARLYYQLGENGIKYLTDDGSRACVIMMYKIYSSLLDEIESNDYDVFSERRYVSTGKKVLISLKYLFSGKKSKEKELLSYGENINSDMLSPTSTEDI